MATENKPQETKQDEHQCTTKRKVFVVYTRFSDRVTFIVLVLWVTFAFIACIGIYSYELTQTQDFWEAGATCIANQDFKCLLDIRVNQSINKDLLLTTMGAALSVIGVIFGSLAVGLYKAFKFTECDCVIKK